MQCEKCGTGVMQSVKRFRSSGCLVVCGFVLIGVSVAALGLAALLGLVGPSAGRQSAARWEEREALKAAAELRKIPDLPPAVVKEFQRDGTVSESTLDGLGYELRTQVRRVLVDHAASKLAGSTGDLAAAGAGIAVTVTLVLLGVPGLIVGLLLVRRRKLWRCGACGFAFDRV